MINKNAGVIAMVALVIAIVGVFTPVVKQVASQFGATSYCGDSQTTCLPSMQFTGNQNTSVPSIQTDAGIVLFSSAATTTTKFYSTSSTKGWCTELNATSTNTLLNMTFRATSTAATVGNIFPSGIVPVISYGACN